MSQTAESLIVTEESDGEFQSVNPWTGEVITRYRGHTDEEVREKIRRADAAFQEWREVPFDKRSELMNRVADLLIERRDDLARTITLEMGKPITESRAEIEKCAWACRFYAENAEDFLADELIETEASESFVSYDPTGVIFAIMPWNFPFWQVFRFAAPALMAGNVGLLKHASGVYGCAIQIEKLFRDAGYPDAAFQALIMGHDKTEMIISHDAISGVMLTGSEGAGSTVGSLAGKHIKKSVLELGGSNAFIVLDDADLESAVDTAVAARMANAGQSCISGKRFIVTDGIYDRFLSSFTEAVKKIRTGDPLEDDTQFGPLARKELAEQLHQQVESSIEMGAELETGGSYKDSFYEPTILTNVRPGMAVFDEETFGPVAAVARVSDEDEAFDLANQSRYGLGVTVFSEDIDKALRYADRVGDGSYFINELVKSDPRLPFGGTRRSGYGRELSVEGIREFVNAKTVYIMENRE